MRIQKAITRRFDMRTGNFIEPFEWKRLNRLTARGLLVALAPLALDGCLSIEMDHFTAKTPTVDARSTLEARLYEKGKDVKRDVKSTREVTWKLFHLDVSPVVPVKEGTGTTWSATDLTAGKYRLAASWGPKPGIPGDTSAGSGDKSFSLAPGETVRADVVLSEFPGWGWALIAVAIAAAITAIVLAVTASATEKAVAGAFGGQSVSTRDLPATTGKPSDKDFVNKPAVE